MPTRLNDGHESSGAMPARLNDGREICSGALCPLDAEQRHVGAVPGWGWLGRVAAVGEVGADAELIEFAP